ncbi:ead/Ea22-like family protein [Enterobacter hormaechei]|uniref:ead/Ea22-like family protein n=1 Tax=Enterobacter hormaechei TaxID=158836 RepID=UPI00403AB4DC
MNINKKLLREAANAANIASWGRWESYHPHKGARGYEVKVGVKAIAQHCLKVDSVFIAAANPATVLALLDELEAAAKQNAQDFQIKARLCRESNSLHDRLREAEKRIAELEAREVTLPKVQDIHPLGPQSAKVLCEFHRNIVNRCADEIRKIGVKVSIKGD